MTDPLPMIVRLERGGVADPSLLGGKGASLSGSSVAECRFPATAVVSTAAYRVALAQSDLKTFVAEGRGGAHRSSSCPRRESTRCSSRTALPAQVEERRSRRTSTPSSARPRSQYGRRRLLRISKRRHSPASTGRRSRSSVAQTPSRPAVRLALGFALAPGAVAYRRVWGVDASRTLAMAAVLVAMVDAVLAGVVFTVDPGTGGDQVRVEVVEGLGESLVSGQVTPSAWTFGRDDTQIRPTSPDRSARRSGSRSRDRERRGHTPGRRVGLERHRALDRPRATHHDDDLRRLRRAGRRPRTHLGGHRRDASRHPARPCGGRRTRFLVEEAFRQTLADLGAFSRPSSRSTPGSFDAVRGRAALDFDLLRESAGLLSRIDAQSELETRYFGPAHAQAPAAGTETRRASVTRQVPDRRVARRRALNDADVVLGAASEFDGQDPELHDRSDAWLLALARRILDLGAPGDGDRASPVAAVGRGIVRPTPGCARTIVGDRRGRRARCRAAHPHARLRDRGDAAARFEGGVRRARLD